MSVLARSWHLDGSRPIEVEVTERESEMLDVNLSKLRVVHGYIEMSREYTSLSGVGGSQVEVEHT